MKASISRAASCALACGAIALGACTTMGTGSGSVSPGGAPVRFAWKSTDGGLHGTMSAALADGRKFSGPYLELTKDVRGQELEPMWVGWNGGWDGWDGFPPFAYATLYSGRVMANLQAADGERMRCHFNLNVPADGMGGGGQGKCQLGSGRSVDAVFQRT